VRYRPLGATGIEVSVVSLGSWLTFGTAVDEERSIACVHRAFEHGVTFFDTANVYGRGRAEEVVGRAVASLPRERVVIGTKVFGAMGPGPDDRGLGRTHVRRECDASLRRLGLDAIDLYQCHRYDPDTPLEETCAVMDELIRAGKVRHWGVSEWTSAQMREAVGLCVREGLTPPATDQPRYSMLDRGVEQDVLSTCAELRLGVLAFSPLAQGMLTGKYERGGRPPEGSRAADPRGAGFLERFFTDENFERVERLRPIAADLGVTLGQLAMAWVLRRPEVTTAIAGATEVAQVGQNVAAADVELDASISERVEAALG
jgi:aryl-alcohol dehydrogenase-like predicted oxidoreductase